MNQRILQKTRFRSRNEALEILQFFLLTELLAPGRHLWIVSPWIRNVELFDNTHGDFADLLPDTPRRKLRLLDVLKGFLLAGTTIRIVRLSPQDDGGVGMDLLALAASLGRDSQVNIRDDGDDLHSKGLLGARSAIIGSMNLTHAGVERRTELMEYTTDADAVSRLELEFRNTYGR